MKEYIKREFYLDKIHPFIGKDIIKVIVGQRRVGKSYMLYQIMDHIRELYERPEIIYINKEDHAFEDIRNHRDLLAFVQNKYSGEKKCFLFIDEVQDIDGFEKALRSLLSSGTCDIYVTGSNAKMLSGEIATILAGRSLSIKIFSLGYKEFLIFHNLED